MKKSKWKYVKIVIATNIKIIENIKLRKNFKIGLIRFIVIIIEIIEDIKSRKNFKLFNIIILYNEYKWENY